MEEDYSDVEEVFENEAEGKNLDSFLRDRGQDEDLPYELTMFLSSDGKHTVTVIGKTKNSRNAGLIYGKKLYDFIVKEYGTKQEQAVRAYSKKEESPKPVDCKHLHITPKESKSEKNPGRWFKKCKDCGDFLGWMDEK